MSDTLAAQAGPATPATGLRAYLIVIAVVEALEGLFKIPVLFSGDAVFWGGAVVLQNVPDVSIPESADSLERLARLEFEGLLPGHLTISLANGRRHVEAAVDYFRRLRLPPPLVP